MKEIWKKVIGVDGYEVSNFGQVRSYRPFNAGGKLLEIPRINKGCIVKQGYVACKIQGKKILVHKIVLETFIGPKKDGQHCRHLDGNKLNNSVKNLKWGSPKENGLDKIRFGEAAKGDRHGSKTHPEKLSRGERHSIIMKKVAARGERASNAKLTEQLVRDIRSYRDQGCKFKDIVAALNVNKSTVAHIYYNRSWSHVK